MENFPEKSKTGGNEFLFEDWRNSRGGAKKKKKRSRRGGQLLKRKEIVGDSSGTKHSENPSPFEAFLGHSTFCGGGVLT